MKTTTQKPRRRAVIYARLSVAAEESVSIDRQLEACRKYCEARGWEVVLVKYDDGVSATKNRPEHRAGWSAILEHQGHYDVVVVWKVDRLARRVLDFLHADESLQERGAALVAVEDPIDMSTPQGRAFATMLAVFGEMEAAAISARVTAARQHLMSVGRNAGGERPWPFDLTPNPDGHGYVLAPIPERAEVIKEAAADLIAGKVTVSDIARRWDAAGLAPKRKPRNGRRGRATWHPGSVMNLLRNPTLYGATIYRGTVLRNKDHTVRIGSHAILDRRTWQELQAAITFERRGRRIADPPLLHGLARCASCKELLGVHRPKSRAETNWKYMCRNRECTAKVYVSMHRLEEYIGNYFIDRFGSGSSVKQVAPSALDPVTLAELEAKLMDLEDALQMTDDDDEALAIIRERKEARADLAALHDEEQPAFISVPEQTMAEAYAAGDKAIRRQLLTVVADIRVEVAPGVPGKKGLDDTRLKVKSRPALADYVAEPVGRRKK